jgi:16S rRNA processing protein RimM
MTADEFTFLVGKIVGFHALGGEVKVRPSTNNPDILLGIKQVRIGSELMRLRSVRIDRKMLLLAFTEYGDRTAVEKFEGAELFCREDELLALSDDEFWIKDLVGLDVFTTEGEHIGKVISIIYGGNDILEIQRESDSPGKTILVPFVQDLVPLIDLKAGRVEVINVPGLLEAQ